MSRLSQTIDNNLRVGIFFAALMESAKCNSIQEDSIVRLMEITQVINAETWDEWKHAIRHAFIEVGHRSDIPKGEMDEVLDDLARAFDMSEAAQQTITQIFREIGNRQPVMFKEKNPNAYEILAATREVLRSTGKSEEQVAEVLTEAQSGDYENLKVVCSRHIHMVFPDS